jgi:hypothetical protein
MDALEPRLVGYQDKFGRGAPAGASVLRVFKSQPTPAGSPELAGGSKLKSRLFFGGEPAQTNSNDSYRGKSFELHS